MNPLDSQRSCEERRGQVRIETLRARGDIDRDKDHLRSVFGIATLEICGGQIAEKPSVVEPFDCQREVRLVRGGFSGPFQRCTRTFAISCQKLRNSLPVKIGLEVRRGGVQNRRTVVLRTTPPWRCRAIRKAARNPRRDRSKSKLTCLLDDADQSEAMLVRELTDGVAQGPALNEPAREENGNHAKQCREARSHAYASVSRKLRR